MINSVIYSTENYSNNKFFVLELKHFLLTEREAYNNDFLNS